MATASGSGTSSDDTGTLTTVPPGVAPGESLSVNMPNGQVLTVSVPGNARPGSIIRVVPSRSVDVMVPHGSKEGDLLRASIGSGNTEEHFVFTVPANIHPGSNMRVMLQAQAQVVEGPQVEARTQTLRLPDSWDGKQLLKVEHGGRNVLVAAPKGSVPGEEIAIDLPSSGEKLQLSFQVPPDCGGDVVAVCTPSGKMVLASLPAGVTAGTLVKISVVDDGYYGTSPLPRPPPPPTESGSAGDAALSTRVPEQAGDPSASSQKPSRPKPHRRRPTLRAVLQARRLTSASRSRTEPIAVGLLEDQDDLLESSSLKV